MSLQKSILKAKIGPGLPKGKQVFGKVKDFSSVHWSHYFTNKETVEITNRGSFCVYSVKNETESTCPAILLLHGGGFSALSWSQMAKYLNSLCECNIFAIDLRGHGETNTLEDENLSSETMSNDIIQIALKLGLDKSPIILVGHSMGGAIAIHTVLKIEEGTDLKVEGVVVIDVVEGSALESLSSMHRVLKSRPPSFPTISRAIEWSVKSGQVRDIDSARVSMPGQLKGKITNEPASKRVSKIPEENNEKPDCPTKTPIVNPNVILEDEEQEKVTENKTEYSDSNIPSSNSKNESSESFDKSRNEEFTWRIDLSKTEPYWEGWFKGLSLKFLSVFCPKLILLAGIDRLDKDLTVGQMQGKFQMQILTNVGHTVHEDSPDKVAEIIFGFLVRNKIVKANVELVPLHPAL